VVLQLPAVREGSRDLWYDVFVPKGQTCVYTEMLEPDAEQDEASPYIRYKAVYGEDPTGRGFYWPESKEKRREYETIARRQPRIAAINYRGDMTGGGEGIFRPEDFRVFAAPENLEKGITDPNVNAWVKAMKGVLESAWDTALGQPKSGSMTAALTGLLVPCSSWHKGEDENLLGKCDFHYDVYLLDLMLKSLDFGALSRELRAEFGKWHPRRVNIEEKQSGVGLIQVFRGTHVPVRGLKVEQGKVERAVNPVLAGDDGKSIPGGAASVQGWQQMGRILVPGGAGWVERGPDGTKETGFIPRICSFTGGSRASDEFDALVHLVTRAIMLSRRTARFGESVAGPTDEQIALANDDDPRRTMLNTISNVSGFANLIENPMRGMCSAPCGSYGILNNQEWCGFHGKQTNSLNGCPQWSPRAA